MDGKLFMDPTTFVHGKHSTAPVEDISSFMDFNTCFETLSKTSLALAGRALRVAIAAMFIWQTTANWTRQNK